MQSKRAWITYTIIRILAIFIPFAVVMFAFPAMPYNWVLGLVVGTIVSAAVSFLFLRDARTRMGDDLASLRARRDTRTELDREEDEVLDETPDADALDETPGADTDVRADADVAAEADTETESDADTDTDSSDSGATPPTR